MKEVSVGVLLPSSSIYPIGKQFEKGLKSELNSLEDVQVEFIPEFTGQGEVKQLENAIEKLKSYHYVDLIAGWVSNKGLMEVAEKVKGETPYFINICVLYKHANYLRVICSGIGITKIFYSIFLPVNDLAAWYFPDSIQKSLI